MSQHDFDIATADANTGLTFRAAVNAALQSLASLSSGASAPTTPYAYQLWADTTTGLLKIRNAANTDWITIGTLANAFLGLTSLATAQTVTAQHTFNPASAGAPFVLGANAQNQLVTGFNADQLDGLHSSDIPMRKNWIINGDCRVAQRPSFLTLANDTYGFGLVDRFAGKATGTAVTAGVLTKGLIGGISTPTTCVQFSNVTITGAGALHLRYRMEGGDAACLANRNVSFSYMTANDFDAASNHTIYFRTPTTTQNDFSSVTPICNSGAISVPAGAGTRVKYENVSLGECKTGLEIEIVIACGAISTKNWYGSEFQLELGAKATDFEYIPYHDQLRRCQRYTVGWKTTTSANIAVGLAYTPNHAAILYPLQMVKTPVISHAAAYVTRGDGGGVCVLDYGIGGMSGFGFQIDFTASDLTAGQASIMGIGISGGGGWFLLDAEL